MTDQNSSSAPMGRFDLAGKTAFIPGGYGEIGAAIAIAFAEHGARVAVAGRDERKLRDPADRRVVDPRLRGAGPATEIEHHAV